MARIEINDLEQKEMISTEEMRKALGGLGRKQRPGVEWSGKKGHSRKGKKGIITNWDAKDARRPGSEKLTDPGPAFPND